MDPYDPRHIAVANDIEYPVPDAEPDEPTYVDADETSNRTREDA